MILTCLASFTVFICFDFCTSDLCSSCCLRTSSLYDVFVLRSVDTLLVFIGSLPTMTCIHAGSLNRAPASAGVRAGMSPLPGGR